MKTFFQLKTIPRKQFTYFQLFFYLQFYATAILSCNCGNEISTVKNNLDYSDIVVSAVVLSKTVTADLNAFAKIEGDTNDYHYKLVKYPLKMVKLKITTLFKGQVSSDTLIIFTAINGAGCGVHFEIGKQYIIYGTNKDPFIRSNKLIRKSLNNNVYWTHSCTRTAPWHIEEETEIIKLTKR